MSMEEWTGFELSELVLDEATRWIAILDDIDNQTFGQDTNNERYADESSTELQARKDEIFAQFNTWLNKHIQHQQAYAEISLLWAKSVCVHEISERMTASNVFSFSHTPKPSQPQSQSTDFATAVQVFKQKHMPILLPYHNADNNYVAQNQLTQNATPAWVYAVSLGLIALGLASPLLLRIL